VSTQRLLRKLQQDLDETGLRGSFVVRDLDTGEELSLEPDLEFAAASLVKVPLALATLDRIHRGELNGATPMTVQPGLLKASGPAGLSKFQYPAVVALDDLVYLSTSMSDNTAADALFTLTPPARVTAILNSFAITGLSVRHPMTPLTETPAERLAPEEAHLAHSLAISAQTTGRGHPVHQLDVTRANTGSARAFVDLLQAVWTPNPVATEVAARLRNLMAETVMRQRLAPDFSSDTARWASKTGTLLNLRHEIGVVEHSDGDRYAVAALTESRVAAASQPQADACMGRVARSLRDELRGNRRR